MSLEVLKREMARQHKDALDSLEKQRDRAMDVAHAVQKKGRLLLLGMGASHWTNRMVLKTYRDLGIDATAEVLSDYIRLPLPGGGQVTLLTSQSGNSGEIKAYLQKQPEIDDHFALTLNRRSFLARSVPSLYGSGPPEEAYAATRSILITLALHGAILECLGADISAFKAVLEEGGNKLPGQPEVSLHPLTDCRTVFLSSRRESQAVLEAASLTFMELARTPALALELGQLIHGPLECLDPQTGLILVRPVGKDAEMIAHIAEKAVTFGLTPHLFDLGHHPAVEGAIHHSLPASTGLEACARLLPAIQGLLIRAAAARVENMGIPLRSAKVTDGEAA